MDIYGFNIKAEIIRRVNKGAHQSVSVRFRDMGFLQRLKFKKVINSNKK